MTPARLTPEREAEIRDGRARYDFPQASIDDLVAELDAVRDERDDYRKSYLEVNLTPEEAELLRDEARAYRMIRDCDVYRPSGVPSEVASAFLAERDAAVKVAEKAKARLDEIETWIGQMPDAGFTDASPRWEWWHKRPRFVCVRHDRRSER